jgi:hypothetical protein
MRVPLPSAGCYKASYPAIAWSRVACVKPQRLPVPRSGEVSPTVVGDGQDYLLSVSPRLISTAIGSFPDVSGVKSVRSVGVAAAGGKCICGKDAFTVQLNSDYYRTKACGPNPRCIGWEQLVYSNLAYEKAKVGILYVQDWRIRTTKRSLKCPPSATGWTAALGDCYYSSEAVQIPKIPVTQLGELSASLNAASTGDSAFLTIGTTVYGMKNIQGDFMDLSRNWTGAEFNIFGDCCGSLVVFNPGSKITVSLEAEDGSTAKPTCQGKGGTTGETNSLSFVGAPVSPPEQQQPSILFTESNTRGGGAASCDTVAGL